MADTDPVDENDIEDGGEANALRDAREAAKRGKAAEQELAALKREREFTLAGIPLPETLNEDDPNRNLVGMFVRAYNGVMEADAIKAEADTIGLLDRLGTDTGDRDPSGLEQDADRFAADFRDGSPPPPQSEGPEPVPGDEALAEFHASLSSGTPRNMAQMEYVAKLIHDSDTHPGMFFDQQAHDARAAEYDATIRGA